MAYAVELPVRCKMCTLCPTNIVFGQFNDTTYHDGYYCVNHAWQRVAELTERESKIGPRMHELDIEANRERQRAHLRELDPQELQREKNRA